MSKYVFMSFSSMHTKKNIGCCIIQCEDPTKANELTKQLGLMPHECNNARGYELNEEEFREQGMELNRLYSSEEMSKMGFQKA
jgi:hypothetical protein